MRAGLAAGCVGRTWSEICGRIARGGMLVKLACSGPLSQVGLVGMARMGRYGSLVVPAGVEWLKGASKAGTSHVQEK